MLQSQQIKIISGNIISNVFTTKTKNKNIDDLLVTQHCESNDTYVAPPSVWEVVDQALVGPSVRQLGVVDENGGTYTRHSGHKTHTTTQVVGKFEHLATLVYYHLLWHDTIRKRERVRG